MYVIENLHWFVLFIGALIFAHELGHFVVAKLVGVKVLRFSLGYGPKLFGFTAGGTEYWVSALPLGGYVKMLGELPAEQDEILPEDRPRAFSARPLWQRSLIVLAGPVANLMLAFAVYGAMFSGTHTFGETRLGVVSHGGPAWKAGLRPGDIVRAIDGRALRDWEDLREAISSRPGQSVSVRYERAGVQHESALTVEGRDEPNVFQELEQRGKVGISLQFVKPVLAVVDPQSPAARAGLRTGDLVVSVNGKATAAWHEVRDAIAQTPVGVPVELVARRDEKDVQARIVPATPLPDLDPNLFSAADTAWGYTGLASRDSVVAEVQPDTPASGIDLRVGDRLLALAIEKQGGTGSIVQPIGVWAVDLAAFQGTDARRDFRLTFQRGREVITRTLKLAAKTETDEFRNKSTRYVFGAKNDESLLGTYTFDRRVGAAEALSESWRQVLDDATVIVKGLAKIARGDLPVSSMGGPIMLFVIAEKSAKRGATYFLRMLAMISVNLGLLNLLPVPVLDGGHMMFFGVEAVRRRPPSLRFREVANMVGLALLFLLMVLVFRNVIMRYVFG